MIFLKFFQLFKWEVLGLLLILFCVYINVFPKGHIILGGDIVQAIRMSENFTDIHYDDLGRDSLFYGLFYVLDKMHVSDTAQISWYIGVFLAGSYLSFLSFCALIFPKASRVVRTISALFYATNLYTLYIFTATWGYSSYQIIYIFIPLLTGLYIKLLETEKKCSLWMFFLAVFLASPSFGNPAFALALSVYFLILTSLIFLFRFVPLNKRALKKISIVAGGAFLLNAYWLLPVIPQMRSGVEEVFTSEIVNLSERLQKTSNAIFDTIRLMPTSEHSRYFPTNFPYPAFSSFKKYFSLLAFIPFFLVVLGFMRKKEKRERRLYVIFFTLFLVFIMLVARVRAPFETLNAFLFHLPGLNTLRSYDKFATFTPFILSVLLLIFFATEQSKKYAKALILCFFVGTVLLALPFYFGGIQTKLSYILSSQKSKDFTTARQSAIVKVPEAYYAVGPLIRDDGGNYKVSMLPYSPGSSIGRVDLPIWKINGPHIARYLYDRQFVELTAPYIPGWKFSEDFKNSRYDPEWITDVYGLIGIKYVLYHKDAKESSMRDLESTRQYLEKIQALRLMQDTDSFFLYSVEEKRLFPYLYTAKDPSLVKLSPDMLSESVEKLRETVSPLEYTRDNPKQITTSIRSFKKEERVILNEKFDPLWKAEYVSELGVRTNLERDMTVKFSNAWKADEDLLSGKIQIYYSPIRLMCLGQWITGISLVILGLLIVRDMRKKYNV